MQSLAQRAVHGLVCPVIMKNAAHDSEWHLRDPRTRKWMVQCTVCKTWGYRQDAPAKFFGRADLQRHFEELKLDERGVCDQCRGAGAEPSRVGP
jgi:hypothetical protein